MESRNERREVARRRKCGDGSISPRLQVIEGEGEGVRAMLTMGVVDAT